ASAVVAHSDLDGAAFPLGYRHGYPPGGRFAPGGASLGLLDAVIDGVPDHMDESVLDLVEDALVDLDLPAAEDERDLLALVSGKIPRKLGEDFEDAEERQGQGLLDVLEEVFRGPAQGHAVAIRGAARGSQRGLQGGHEDMVPVQELPQAG